MIFKKKENGSGPVPVDLSLSPNGIQIIMSRMEDEMRIVPSFILTILKMADIGMIIAVLTN